MKRSNSFDDLIEKMHEIDSKIDKLISDVDKGTIVGKYYNIIIFLLGLIVTLLILFVK